VQGDAGTGRLPVFARLASDCQTAGSSFTGAAIASQLPMRLARACRKAGLEGRLVHDLRRTAARDFRRQGVPEGEIMKLCGWKTRAMFDRYNMIDEAGLAEAVAKRSRGQTTANKGQTAANIGTPTAPLSPLSSSPV